MDLYSFKFIILVLNEIKNQLSNEFYVKARIPTMKLVYKESGLWVGSFWSFELCGAMDFSVWLLPLLLLSPVRVSDPENL